MNTAFKKSMIFSINSVYFSKIIWRIEEWFKKLFSCITAGTFTNQTTSTTSVSRRRATTTPTANRGQSIASRWMLMITTQASLPRLAALFRLSWTLSSLYSYLSCSFWFTFSSIRRYGISRALTRTFGFRTLMIRSLSGLLGFMEFLDRCSSF